MVYQWPDGKRPAEVYPPCDLLREELKERGLLPMTPIDFFNLPRHLVRNILFGAIPITPQIAARLSEKLGTSAQTWLNHQERWDAWWPEELQRYEGGSDGSAATGD